MWLALLACRPADPPVPGSLLEIEGEPVPRVSRPLWGGAAASDDRWLLALDVDGDRLIALPQDGSEPREIRFPRGWAPRAVALDGDQAAVTLQGVGAVALVSLDPLGAELLPVCPEPRGVDLRQGRWVVACAGGELVLPDQTLRLRPDLGDVLLTAEGALVTEVRAARILRVDLERGELTDEIALPVLPDLEGRPLVARAARRLVRVGDGRLAALHQAHAADEIALSLAGEIPYGTGACDAVARPALTWLDPRGQPEQSVRLDAVLPVDLAFWQGDGAFPEPTPVIGSALSGAGRGLSAAYPPSGLADPALYCVPRGALVGTEGHVSGAALWRGQPAAVTRWPFGVETAAGPLVPRSPGEDPPDEGALLFHAPSPSGLACASCHVDGREDGHVWQIEGMGPRRTQSLAVGLGQSPPYHWDGALADLGELLADTGELRMGMAPATPSQIEALSAWLDALPAPAPELPPAPGSLGEALFAERCAACHAPPQAQSHDVGTGGLFQAPSLQGVGARLPLMHDGCARTLQERFEPACGGEAHGGELSAEQVDALVVYLRSL